VRHDELPRGLIGFLETGSMRRSRNFTKHFCGTRLVIRVGIAISEPVEVATQHADTKYSLGSVLNHVLLHQTVIGQEAMAQLEMAGDYPDIIVGCGALVPVVAAKRPAHAH
jgi:hypothetical protein